MRRRLRPLAGVVAAWGRHLADFFLPERCVVCGRVLSQKERFICCFCDADLPLTRYWLQEKQPMADRYNAQIQQQLGAYEAPGRAAALFFYREEAGFKWIPQGLKYEGRRALGRYFGERLGRELAGSPLFADVDLIVPVPLHPFRRFRRGYNQAEVLARAVAKAYEDALATNTSRVPPVVSARLVRRIRATRTQTRLSGEEKRKNVAGAFRVSPREYARLALAPRHILVVDDVFTTGATLGAVHAALRTVFPPEVSVSVATLAYVPGE